MRLLPGLDSLRAAASLVHAVVAPTPAIRWPLLAARSGAEVWVKHENHTPVGAFKLRGGLVYFDRLTRDRLTRGGPGLSGVIAATRGNHGQSVAFCAALHGLRAVIVVPHGNSPEKNSAMQALKAELIEAGDDFQAAFEHAARLAEAERLQFVPSFAEPLVEGVATLYLELFESVPDLDAVYVPIGLGSGICGALAARAALGLNTEIIGVVAAAAPAYALSFAARRPIAAPVASTVADGMACRVPDPAALTHILAGVSRIVTVEESEIRAAMRHLFTDTHNTAEGAGAAAFAALLQERDRMRGRRVAVMLTGGNVDAEIFGRILTERGLSETQ
jgi:threonine dehydratase